MTPIESTALNNLTRQIRSISDETLDEIANSRVWGTYGPDGKSELTWKKWSELDTEHIENILITQPVNELQVRVFLHILKKRYSRSDS